MENIELFIYKRMCMEIAAAKIVAILCRRRNINMTNIFDVCFSWQSCSRTVSIYSLPIQLELLRTYLLGAPYANMY